jgi:hypothetical protein
MAVSSIYFEELLLSNAKLVYTKFMNMKSRKAIYPKLPKHAEQARRIIKNEFKLYCKFNCTNNTKKRQGKIESKISDLSLKIGICES